MGRAGGDSRRVIRDLIRERYPGRVPWTLDFGSCKGVHPSIVEAVRRRLGIQGSFAAGLGYDVWIALDPDRIHNDPLPHAGPRVKARVPVSNLQSSVPLSRRAGFDYASYFPRLPEGAEVVAGGTPGAPPTAAEFDSFGLCYYPWPGNPEYQAFLSPLEHTEDARRIAELPMPEILPADREMFGDDVRHIVESGKMSAAWSGSLFELSWYLRGRERLLYDLSDNPSLVDRIAEKVAGFVEELTRVNVESGVDILCFYDDLGSQGSTVISPEAFRRYYKPHYRRIWGALKDHSPNRSIFLHACGNISAIIPDLIDCGLDILNPVQPEAMDVAAAAREYSHDLAFWGTLSVQSTLPRGTRADVFGEVRQRVQEVGSRGSLILGPANTLGKDVPLENIEALVEACRTCCG
jgi:uroporphyrinogen decarboxylase